MNTVSAFASPVIEITEPSRREPTVAVPDPHSPRTSSPAQESGDESDGLVTRLSWKVAILGWIFLATEVAVMAALYQRGEGRTARKIYIFGICEIFGCDKDAFSATSVFSESGEDVSSDSSNDEDQCTIGEGLPYLAEVLALRAAIATLAQLLAFCRPNGRLWVPHKAAFVIMNKIFVCCFQMVEEQSDTIDDDQNTIRKYVDRNGRVVRTERGSMMTPICAACMLLFMGIPVAVLSLYSWYPAYCGIQAVCELVTHATLGVAFVICALICSCVCAAGGGSEGFRNHEGDEEDAKDTRRGIVWFQVFLDSLLVGIFFVWGNFVQSGFAAFVFALVPAFNLFALLSGPSFLGMP